MTPAETLDRLIGDCYGAKRGLRPRGAETRFREALAADPDLLALARARKTELEATVTARRDGNAHGCILAKEALDALRSVLAEPAA